MVSRELRQYKIRKMENNKNKIKNLKKIKTIAFLSLIAILFSLASYAYYTNTNKYFEDSRKDDLNSGYALEREADDFIVDGCGTGTMLDTVTGLCWLKNMNTFVETINWSQASSDCSGSTVGERSDWRVPTIPELFTLIDQIGGSGSTCTTLGNFGFTGCQDGYYWSSEEYQPNADYAWHVSFGYGNSNSNFKPNSDYVTCVARNS